jgi:predicted MFS family arabinose efflux permease
VHASPLTPGRERLLLLVLAAVQFAHIVDFMILMPLGPRLMHDFGISPGRFGELVSAYTFSAGLFSLMAAPLLDRFTRKTALLCSFSGFIAATAFCGIAPTFSWLMLGRVVAGCFGGTSASLVVASVADVIPLERRGAAMGIVMTSFSLASVLGVPLGLFAANNFGWRAPFLILGALAVALFALAAGALPRVQRAPRAAGESVSASLLAIFAVPRHWLSFSFTMTLMFSGFVVIPYISPTLVQNCGVSNEHLPYVYMAGGLFTFFSMPWIGRMADRYGLFRVFAVMSLLTMPAIAAVTHFGSHIPLGLILAVTTAFMVCASGRFAPAMTLVTSAVEPRHRGGFLSVNTAFQQIASGLAAMTAALILSSGPNGTILHYGTTGWIGIAALGLSIFLASRIRKAPRA